MYNTFTGFSKYKTIIKSLTSLEIDITGMMKRHQYINKLQSELIQEKKFIDQKLDEAIAKHCYPEKNKIWVTATSCHTQNSISYEIHKTWQNSKHNSTHNTHHTTAHTIKTNTTADHK